MSKLLTGKMIGLLAALLIVPAVNADTSDDVRRLQNRWAEVNYQLIDDAQLDAFEQLVEDAEVAIQAAPNSAEVLIWSGIIKSTYAGAKGGLGALALAKAAKADFEAAMDIDADALDGSAYTSLGILYHSVPGWPVGFGSDKKAEQLLETGVKSNPAGIDNNYFYAVFMADEKKYDVAREYFLKAQAAAPRPGRELADEGRQKEIAAALADLK